MGKGDIVLHFRHCWTCRHFLFLLKMEGALKGRGEDAVSGCTAGIGNRTFRALYLWNRPVPKKVGRNLGFIGECGGRRRAPYVAACHSQKERNSGYTIEWVSRRSLQYNYMYVVQICFLPLLHCCLPFISVPVSIAIAIVTETNCRGGRDMYIARPLHRTDSHSVSHSHSFTLGFGGKDNHSFSLSAPKMKTRIYNLVCSILDSD